MLFVDDRRVKCNIIFQAKEEVQAKKAEQAKWKKKQNSQATFRKIKEEIFAFNFVNFVLQYLYSSNLQVN